MGLQRDAALFGALFAGSGPGALFARNTYERKNQAPPQASPSWTSLSSKVRSPMGSSH